MSHKPPIAATLKLAVKFPIGGTTTVHAVTVQKTSEYARKNVSNVHSNFTAEKRASDGSTRL